MKKKIAVCGNGWSNEYLKIVMRGIRQCAIDYNVDIFFFMNYSVSDGDEFVNACDANIYRLPDFKDFDGVVLLANTLHLQEEFDYLQKQIKDYNIPAVSLEYDLPDIDSFGSDNYSGMYELCCHLVEHHNVKDVLFVSGPKGNQESDSRRKALEDALAKHGYSLEEENVVYGNWFYYEVQDKVPAWLKGRSKLPDAVVCANDVMAMAASAILENMDIDVPGEVIVTGFDHLSSSMTFSPMIASVDRNWDNMSYQGLKYLLDKIDGKEDTKIRYVKSKAVPSESCGCAINESDKRRRKHENRGSYDRFVDSVFYEGHLCNVGDSMAKAMSDHELHVAITYYMQADCKYEGQEFYVCLVDNFFSALKDGTSLQKVGYTEKMDVICAIKDGKAQPRMMIDRKELVPGYDPDSEGARFYVFLPIYTTEGCYGYAAFADEVPMMYDYRLVSWGKYLEQNLERARQNLVLVQLNEQLAELSVTDSLTGVYNRMGCEKKAYPFLEQCHAQGKTGVLMFADINKMKVINDKFGHIQGDVAICTVAKSIKEVLSDDWIVVRYGGDEFLMVGECTDEEQIKKMLREISEHLENNAVQMHLPYRLKAGVGYVLVEPDEQLDLSECLKKADDAMYLMKKKQHDEIEV